MRIVVIISFLFLASSSFAQTLKFNISGLEDTTINLVRYFGKGLYYTDTAELKNGVIEFDGSKQKAGILVLFLPGQNLLEFVYNDEDVTISANAINPMLSVVVEKSEENVVFQGYVKFIGSQRMKTQELMAERAKLDPVKDKERYDELTRLAEKATTDVVAYQQNIVDTHWDKLVSRIIKMSMDVKIPEAPVNADGKIIDSTYRFRYFRDHYFDNVDFTDDRLARTPIFHGKLSGYFDPKMMIQHWDTVIKYANVVCDQLPAKSEMLQYCVSWITSDYEKSKIMGMDKVFFSMAKRYYCANDENGESKAHWMPADKLSALCERASDIKETVMGNKPPDLRLRDTTDVNWQGFYELDNEFTILYFWDPECGHCKKITPKLQTLYAKKFRDRNIDVFAVGKAVGGDFKKWKAYIKKENLEFINVAVTNSLYTAASDTTPGALGARAFIPEFTTLEALNYQKTYDVFQTPKVFVLDKDKRIIAKNLSISQLEDMMDKRQGFTDLEVLFPIEEEPEDEQDI